jgi:hypothetical protein
MSDWEKSDGKVYELRTYDVQPHLMSAYAKLAKEHFHLRVPHSKILGFWQTEIGGINQVVHLCEYDSLTSRKTIRDKLSQDPEWVGKFVGPCVQYLSKMNNSLLIGNVNREITTEPGWFYNVLEFESDVEALPEKLLRSCKDVELCGSWMTAYAGVEGRRVQMWRSRNLDTLCNPSWAVQRAAVRGLRSQARILYPAAFLSHLNLPWS